MSFVLEETMKRRGIDANITLPLETTQYLVEYKYKKEPKVSIIIPTKDLLLHTARRCNYTSSRIYTN